MQARWQLVPLLAVVVLPAHARSPPPVCPARPAKLVLPLPATGLTASADGQPCTVPKSTQWTKAASRGVTVWSGTDGPHGSGRYWSVALAVSKSPDGPRRGICFRTQTIGWRTYRGAEGLKWVDDVDGDGHAELVLWDSFGTTKQTAAGAFGLVGWVYKPYGDTLVLDYNLTRALAARLAAEYRKPTEPASLQTARSRAAATLSEIAHGVCRLDR